MSNIIDYLCCEFDPLSERPLGDVDSLVLSWLSYYRLLDDAKGARTMRGEAVAGLYRMRRFGETTAIAAESCHLRAAGRFCPRWLQAETASRQAKAVCGAWW